MSVRQALPPVMLAALAMVVGGPAWARQVSRVPQAGTVHIVAPGDTLWSIASTHKTTVEALAAANRLPSLDRLQIGDRLRVVAPLAPAARTSAPPKTQPQSPTPQDGRHIARSGETLWAIAQRHATTASALARINELDDADRLAIGQTIELLGRMPTVRRAPPQPVALPRSAVRPAVRPGFLWPSRGVITSRFGFRGRRHHHGIDIAAPIGTPITAAKDGVVTFAGMQGGYGRVVILDHGDGLTTWYGHASVLVATVGQRVQRGELIARVGTTGHVTGANLHFEVRRNNTPLDPLPFLQRAR